MKTYNVTLPVCGYAIVTVSSDSEGEAIDAAYNSDFDSSNLEEWSVYYEIVSGNVFLGPVNRPYAVEVEAA